MPKMLTSTTFHVEGYRVVEHIGVVRGIVVRSPTIMQGFLGNMKQMIGGRIESFTEMCEQARKQAFEEMVEHALDVEANAIIGVRYDASSLARGATEVLCYGTAVRVERA
jgi:uncharacterized protein YbjQ (UPF0145 family)